MSANDSLVLVLPAIKATAFYYASSFDEREELVQLAAVRFLKAWPQVRRGSNIRQIGGWAKSLARGIGRNFVRNKKRYAGRLQRAAAAIHPAILECLSY